MPQSRNMSAPIRHYGVDTLILYVTSVSVASMGIHKLTTQQLHRPIVPPILSCGDSRVNIRPHLTPGSVFVAVPPRTTCLYALCTAVAMRKSAASSLPNADDLPNRLASTTVNGYLAIFPLTVIFIPKPQLGEYLPTGIHCATCEEIWQHNHDLFNRDDMFCYGPPVFVSATKTQ